MYIFYAGPNDQDAYLAETRQENGRPHVNSTWLGKVLDKERGIYQSRERGVFTYDLATGEYGEPPEDFFQPHVTTKQSPQELMAVVDFGDAFFFNSCLQTSGLWTVLDRIFCKNRETLHAMLLFYLLNGAGTCSPRSWYEGSITSWLYPRAKLSGQGLNSFLTSMGDCNCLAGFQKTNVPFVQATCGSDSAILMDFPGFPDGTHPASAWDHNGLQPFRMDAHLILAIHQSSGVPLFYIVLSGGVVGKDMLAYGMSNLDAMKTDISLCLLDTVSTTDPVLDLFYEKGAGDCKTGFLGLVDPDDPALLAMSQEELGTLDSGVNFVEGEDSCFFIRRKRIPAGAGKDKAAWLYLCANWEPGSPELPTLFRRARSGQVSTEEISALLRSGTLFGLLSGLGYSLEEVLPAYEPRLAARPMLDYARNYAKLLPYLDPTAETWNGHLLLSFLAYWARKMMEIPLRKRNLMSASMLAALRNQKCAIFPDRIVVMPPKKDARKLYDLVGVTCPGEIPLVNGKPVWPSPNAQGKN